MRTRLAIFFFPHTTTTDKKMDDRLRQQARDLVSKRMASYDPSHDDLHVFRVVRMALRIAESVNADPVVVELAALFHDLCDHKYENDGDQAVAEITDLMISNGVTKSQSDLVVKVVKNTGFTVEKKLKAAGKWTEWHEQCNELKCVQDADRLDAIGALGVFRASAFSASRNRPLYEPSNPNTAHQHFYDKLLILKDTMKTDLGKRVAENRQKIMAQVAALVEDEYNLVDFS